MDLRLGQAGVMLRTFLEDELSETHLGLSSAARAHLERFRSFLLAFYTTQLGYYPPASIDTRATIFEPEVYRSMHDDFEALYELLVDETFTSAESTPFLAQGGICTVQSVHSFDLRYRYKPLDHPLPLLPEVVTARNSKRMSWLPLSRDKLKPDQRLVAHAALIKATNTWNKVLLSNDLVKAYRKFEEDSIAPMNKVDRNEKINLVDARKVRWILVYSIYQVLKNIILAPSEVRDTDDIEYHISVSTENLPPWREDRNLQSVLQPQNLVSRTSSTSTSGWNSSVQSTPSKFVTELKPDIDYFALTHKATPTQERPSRSMTPNDTGRSRSLTRAFSKDGALRRRLSLFRKEESEPEPLQVKKASYHEIVVHGYGNGTNVVNVEASDEPDTPSKSTTNRTLSTSSNPSSESGSDSNGSSAETAESSLPPMSPKSELGNLSWESQGHETNAPIIPPRGRRREITSYISPGSQSQPILSSRDEFSSSPPVLEVRRRTINYAASYEALVRNEENELAKQELSPSPLVIKKLEKGQPFALADDPESWGELELTEAPLIDQEVQDEWEQYTGLGGHTPVEPVPVEA
jgi:hypothetical protein